MQQVQHHTGDTEVVGGEALVPQGRPARVFPRNRLCAERDCETRLSIYNETQYCSLHGSESPRLRGAARPKKG